MLSIDFSMGLEERIHWHFARTADDINKMTLGGLGHLFCVRLEYCF